jgi:hypothetical protein
MSGAYTLPKLNIQTSASFQSEPGFGLLTNWNVGRTTRYAADCKGPCTPGALVVPNMTDTAIVVPLIPSGYEFVGALNQFDLKLAKLFTVRGVRLTGQFEMFNALNASAVLALRGTQTTQNANCSQCAPSNPTGTYIGTPLYHQPGDIVQGRLYKIGMQVRW